MQSYALRPRPRFALWLFERGLDYADVAGRDGPLGVSVMTVSLICRPFDDPKRRVPAKKLMEKIIALTEGECPPNSFFAHTLAGYEPATACEAAR